MGRIRTIKPEFFRSRSLAKVSREARMTFQGLWCEADDFGRGIADARIVKGAVWPLDDDIDADRVEAMLAELEQTGHIRTYAVDDDRFYEIVSWADHQSAAYRRGVAVHPEPPAQQDLHDESCKEVQDARRVVLEGKGTGNRERGTGKPPTPVDSEPVEVVAMPPPAAPPERLSQPRTFVEIVEPNGRVAISREAGAVLDEAERRDGHKFTPKERRQLRDVAEAALKAGYEPLAVANAIADTPFRTHNGVMGQLRSSKQKPPPQRQSVGDAGVAKAQNWIRQQEGA